MLSALMGAWAAHYHGSGVRALVEQIDHYCNQHDVLSRYDSETHQRVRDLAALGEQAQYAPIIDASRPHRSKGRVETTMWDGISDARDPNAHELAQARLRDSAAIPLLVELRQRAADGIAQRSRACVSQLADDEHDYKKGRDVGGR